MRSIKLISWKAKTPSGEDREENLLDVFTVLIASKRPEEMPRGLEKFRLFGRLSAAFDSARETKVLKLEEAEYKFLKTVLEQDCPAIWGMNKFITQAVDSFMSAKED
jgi:hypothetical protein